MLTSKSYLTDPRVRPLAVALQPRELDPWVEDRLRAVPMAELVPGLPHGTKSAG